MRVVFFRHSLLSRGGDKMIALHASHLAARGHDVTIKANIVDTVFSLDPRIKIAAPPLSGKLGTLVSAAICKQDADAVVADIIPLICLLSLRNHSSLLYYAQDYDESYYESKAAGYFIRLLYIIGLFLLRVRTVTVSPALADLLKNRFNARATTVENGVDRSIFYASPDSELLTAKNKRRAILLLARHDHRKGFDIARRVIEKLQTRMSTSSFEIWTVGESAAGLFPNLNHRDFGRVDENRLRGILSSADIFFYPSRHEGFPLMPLEAFACGCTVITTDAVPYAVQAENCLVGAIEDEEAMLANLLRVLMDHGLCERLSHNAFQFAQSHDLQKCLDEFMTVLSRFVKTEG